MSNYQKNYLQAIFICHGKSEYTLVQHLKQVYKANVEVIYDKNSSIQITRLKEILGNMNFKSFKVFTNKYKKKLEKPKDKKLSSNFKFFIIMDTDDCSEQIKDDFIKKNMFKNHWLVDHIFPIFNDLNLEDVLKASNVINITDKKVYGKIFPTGKLNNTVDTSECIEISNKLKTKRDKNNLFEIFDFFENNYNN